MTTKSGVRALLTADEWAVVHPLFKEWLDSGSDYAPERPLTPAESEALASLSKNRLNSARGFTPRHPRDVLQAAVLLMQDRAIEWCRETPAVIRLSNRRFTAKTRLTKSERYALLQEDWVDRFTDVIDRFVAPYLDRNGNARTPRVLQRLRESEEGRWRTEIENAIWFAIGTAMNTPLRRQARTDFDRPDVEVEAETLWRPSSRRGAPASGERTTNGRDGRISLVLEVCRNNHERCAEVMAEASTRVRPNGALRAAILLADAYRIGEFDRMHFHRYYRDIPVHRTGVTLGAIIDKLDEMMGLPPNLPIQSVRRSNPPRELPYQAAVRDACAAAGINFGTDTAAIFKKFRDDFLKEICKILKLDDPRRGSSEQDGDMSAGGDFE